MRRLVEKVGQLYFLSFLTPPGAKIFRAERAGSLRARDIQKNFFRKILAQTFFAQRGLKIFQKTMNPARSKSTPNTRQIGLRTVTYMKFLKSNVSMV